MVKPVTLSGEPAPEGKMLQMFGWGTPFSLTGSRELLTGGITVLHRESCPQNLNNRFCAGPSFFGGCQGDDGGAVVLNASLFGLIDFRTAEYCSGTYPGHLYIKTTDYNEWIKEVINSSTTITTSFLLFSLVGFVKLFV